MTLPQKADDYRKSTTYRKADTALRRQLEAYKADQKLSDEHMAWQMYLQDLRAMPKEERQKGNRMAESSVIGAMVVFLVAIQSKSKVAMLIASLLVIAMTAVYLSGVLNPYTDTLRRVKRYLKKSCPAAQDFAAWQKARQAPDKDQ